jgi:hypothetical protein
MATPRRTARAARSGVAPVCAICLALLGSVALAACLNPMPEEFPSDRDPTPVTLNPNEDLGVGAAGTGGSSAGGAYEVNGGSPQPAEPPPSAVPVEGPSAGADAGVDAATSSDTVTDATP